MTNSYQEEWEAYRVRKRKLIVLLVAQFVGLIPFVTLVALIDRKVFSTTSLVMPAAVAWVSGISPQSFAFAFSPARDAGKTSLEVRSAALVHFSVESAHTAVCEFSPTLSPTSDKRMRIAS